MEGISDHNQSTKGDLKRVIGRLEDSAQHKQKKNCVETDGESSFTADETTLCDVLQQEAGEVQGATTAIFKNENKAFGATKGVEITGIQELNSRIPQDTAGDETLHRAVNVLAKNCDVQPHQHHKDFGYGKRKSSGMIKDVKSKKKKQVVLNDLLVTKSEQPKCIGENENNVVSIICQEKLDGNVGIQSKEGNITKGAPRITKVPETQKPAIEILEEEREKEKKVNLRTHGETKEQSETADTNVVTPRKSLEERQLDYYGYHLLGDVQPKENIYKKKERIAAFVSKMITSKFPDFNNMGLIDHMTKCLVLTLTGNKLFETRCQDPSCKTDLIVQHMNEHFNSGGNPAEENFWSLMLLYHSNKCIMKTNCRVELCHSYHLAISSMIPDSFTDVFKVLMVYKIGKGSFGNVCHVMSYTESKKKISTFALKQKETSQNIFHRDLQEFVNSIKCEHIVKHRFHRGFILMEYGDIGLDKYLHMLGSGLSYEGCLLISRHVMGALNYLHCRHWVHRDVKCANIVLCWKDGAFDAAKLCDLDFLHPAYELSFIASSNGHRPPEIIRLLKSNMECLVSPKADIYAFGRSLYQIWTGNELRNDLTDESIIKEVESDYNHAGKSFVLLHLIIMLCLKENPDHRCSAGNVIAVLEKFRAHWANFVLQPPDALTSPTHPTASLKPTIEKEKCNFAQCYLKKVFRKFFKAYHEVNLENIE